MKKKKFALRTMTDIKVFILFLLDNIGYPIDHTAVIGMLSENTEEIIFDYDECLRDLVDRGHLFFDEYEGERFYMISDTGRMIASELYDTIDKDFREKSLKYSAKYVSPSKSGASIKATVTEGEGGRFTVNIETRDTRGTLLSASIAANSREAAETMKKNYEAKPDAVYRGIMFALTGKFEFLS